MLFADLIPNLSNFLVALVLFGSVREWFRAAFTIHKTGEWLPMEPRRPVPWGDIDLFLVVLLACLKTYELWQRFSAAPPPPPPPPTAFTVLVSGGLMLFLATMTATIVFLRNGCTPRDFGWAPEQFLSDVRLGARAFLLLAPIVYGIQFLLTKLHPTEHPLIQRLRDTPALEMFAACGFSVVICAPLYEEFLYRVLLQGWLEKVAGDKSGRPANWPVIVSALWFALMHFDHGADPVPLFVLALGLGYLYQRTHRITPVVVVHALLNFCTWLMLVFEAYSPRR